MGAINAIAYYQLCDKQNNLKASKFEELTLYQDPMLKSYDNFPNFNKSDEYIQILLFFLKKYHKTLHLQKFSISVQEVFIEDIYKDEAMISPMIHLHEFRDLNFIGNGINKLHYIFMLKYQKIVVHDEVRAEPILIQSDDYLIEPQESGSEQEQYLSNDDQDYTKGYKSDLLIDDQIQLDMSLKELKLKFSGDLIAITANILVLYEFEEQERVLGEVEIDLFDMNNDFREGLKQVFDIPTELSHNKKISLVASVKLAQLEYKHSLIGNTFLHKSKIQNFIFNFGLVGFTSEYIKKYGKDKVFKVSTCLFDNRARLLQTPTRINCMQNLNTSLQQNFQINKVMKFPFSSDLKLDQMYLAFYITTCDYPIAWTFVKLSEIEEPKNYNENLLKPPFRNPNKFLLKDDRVENSFISFQVYQCGNVEELKRQHEQQQLL